MLDWRASTRFHEIAMNFDVGIAVRNGGKKLTMRFPLAVWQDYGRFYAFSLASCQYHLLRPAIFSMRKDQGTGQIPTMENST
jgi:hypothetical protein